MPFSSIFRADDPVREFKQVYVYYDQAKSESVGRTFKMGSVGGSDLGQQGF